MSGTHSPGTGLQPGPERVRGCNAPAIRHQRARRTMRNLALPFHVSVEQGIHHEGAARIGEQLATQADQSTARHAKFDSHPAIAMIMHVDDLALRGSPLLQNYTDVVFRHDIAVSFYCS